MVKTDDRQAALIGNLVGLVPSLPDFVEPRHNLLPLHRCSWFLHRFAIDRRRSAEFVGWSRKGQ